MALSENKQIGSYRLVREIGRGGMGVVYEVLRESDGEILALKVLSASRSGDEDAVRRFFREGEIAKELAHPNIVRIHEVGRDGDLSFIAMDLHAGPTLEDLIFELRRARRDALEHFLPGVIPQDERPQDCDLFQQTIAHTLAQVAKAVEYAHQNGLVHRDIKPGNILIAGPQELKLTDFGLVREISGEKHTLTGDILGTPLYMSPEQIMGRREVVGARSDVYALGVTLHECLGLEAPYSATDITNLARQIEVSEPRDLAELNPSLPGGLVTIVRRAMAKRPEDRYAGAALLADDLERFVAGRSIVARPPGALEHMRGVLRRRPELTIVASTLLAALILFGGYLGWADRAERERRADEAQLSYREGRALLRQGSFAAAWRAAAEAESLAPKAPWAELLRDDVEAAFERDFRTRMNAGTAGLLRVGELFAALDELPGHELDVEEMRVRHDVARRALLARAARIEDPAIDRVFDDYAGDHPEELDALRAELGPSFSRALGEKMGRFAFVEASRLAERASRWGVKLSRLPGSPRAAAMGTRPGHIELEALAGDLFSDDAGLRRRSLARLADPSFFVRLPWSDTERLLRRFVAEIDNREDARAFLRLVDALALPGFGANLVDLVRRYSGLSRSLVALAGRHPDPAFTEFLLGMHATSGRKAMSPDITGALRGADLNDVRRLALELENWKEHRPEGFRLLVYVLERRELADLPRRLEALAERIDRPEHLATVLEVLARTGRVLPEEKVLSCLAHTDDERRVELLAGLPAEALRRWAAERLDSEDEGAALLALRALLAAPAKARDLLLEIAEDDSADLDARGLALFALGSLGDERIEARLVKLARDSSWSIRRSALAALARRDGTDRRGGRFAVMFELGVDRFRNDPEVEVRAAAVDLLASLSAHEVADELVTELENWQPDFGGEILERLLGNARQIGEIAQLVESLGFTPISRRGGLRRPDREVLGIALCRTLGILARDPDWEDERSRRRAALAIVEKARIEEGSLDLVRTAWEALDYFRDEVPVSELVLSARGLARADAIAAAGRTLIRRSAGKPAAQLLMEIPVPTPVSRATAALAYLDQGLHYEFEEELVRAWVSGLRDLDDLGSREALRGGVLSPIVREIDRRLRTERLVD